MEKDMELIWLEETILASKLISTNNQLTRVLVALKDGSFVGTSKNEETNVSEGIMFKDGNWLKSYIDNSEGIEDDDRLSHVISYRTEALCMIKDALMTYSKNNEDIRETAMINYYLENLIALA